MIVDTNRPTDGFLFYASTLDVIEEYPEEAQWKLALTVLDFAFHNEADGVFECSTEEYLALRHCFIGITQEKKRYALKQRLERIQQVVERLPAKTALDFAAKEQALKSINELKLRGKRNPDQVRETDIRDVVGSKIYARVTRPDLLRKEFLESMRGWICQAPMEQRETLTRELDDLVNFVEKLCPSSLLGIQEEKTAPAQSTQAKLASEPEPVRLVGKYAMLAKMTPEERAARNAPKPHAEGLDSSPSKPFQCHDFEWDKMDMTKKSMLFSSFD